MLSCYISLQLNITTLQALEIPSQTLTETNGVSPREADSLKSPFQVTLQISRQEAAPLGGGVCAQSDYSMISIMSCLGAHSEDIALSIRSPYLFVK